MYLSGPPLHRSPPPFSLPLVCYKASTERVFVTASREPFRSTSKVTAVVGVVSASLAGRAAVESRPGPHATESRYELTIR
ncbi:hypothetical protein KGM_213399 [Danaus plexippus plexippus]|uniref:Uncharacterized protein n=1 Tax=Danaus plexippus plexippus TaxID=278856 RepID=A0A212FPT3_DANPL|nr:hypothetical protein KGM_213399 [Danaus plexippus plexippus]